MHAYLNVIDANISQLETQYSLCIETYEMISTCNPNIAGWTEDGTMFVIKDQVIFAAEIIPTFFEHNKFTSFARQLNFYGFRKMQVNIGNSAVMINQLIHFLTKMLMISFLFKVRGYL